MKNTALLWAALVGIAAAAADVNPTNPTQTQKGVEQTATPAQPNARTVQGCFSSAGSLVSNGTVQYNTISSCGDVCLAMKKPVGATTGGTQCYCGDKYPPKDKLVDDSHCNIGCGGFDWDACGGINYWTVYNLGLTVSVPFDGEDASSSGVVTAPGSTATVTTTSVATNGSSSGPSPAGIAAGVVVGVVVVAGLVGAFFFYVRRRRNRDLSEEHRRNAAINNFMNGGKPPGSSGGFSASDSRLDPVMAQRRMSDGSIADNQDYSRKILRVTNA